MKQRVSLALLIGAGLWASPLAHSGIFADQARTDSNEDSSYANDRGRPGDRAQGGYGSDRVNSSNRSERTGGYNNDRVTSARSRSGAPAGEKDLVSLMEHIAAERRAQFSDYDRGVRQVDRGYGRDSYLNRRADEAFEYMAQQYDLDAETVLKPAAEALQGTVKRAVDDYLNDINAQVAAAAALRVPEVNGTRDQAKLDSETAAIYACMAAPDKKVKYVVADVYAQQKKLISLTNDLANYVTKGQSNFKSEGLADAWKELSTTEYGGTFLTCCQKGLTGEGVETCKNLAGEMDKAVATMKTKVQETIIAVKWPSVPHDLGRKDLLQTASIRRENEQAFDRMRARQVDDSRLLAEVEEDRCYQAVKDKQRRSHAISQATQTGAYTLNAIGCILITSNAEKWGLETANMAYNASANVVKVPLLDGKAVDLGCGPQMKAVQEADMRARAANLRQFEQMQSVNSQFYTSLRRLPNMSMNADAGAPVLNVPNGSGGTDIMVAGRGYIGGLPPIVRTTGTVSTTNVPGVGGGRVSGQITLSKGSSGSRSIATSSSRSQTALASRSESSPVAIKLEKTRTLTNAVRTEQGLQLGRTLTLGVRRQSAKLAQSPKPKEAQALAADVKSTRQLADKMLVTTTKKTAAERRTLAAASANKARSLSLNASGASTSAADLRDYYARLKQSSGTTSVNVGTKTITDTKAENLALYQQAQSAGLDWIDRRTSYAAQADDLKLQIADAIAKRDQVIQNAELEVADKNRKEQLSKLLNLTQKVQENDREISVLYAQWQIKQQAVFDCNIQLNVLTQFRPDLGKTGGLVTPSGVKGSRALPIDNTAFLKFFKFFDLIPSAVAASPLWGAFNSEAAFKKAWLGMIDNVGADVQKHNLAEKKAFAELKEGVAGFKKTIDGENVPDTNVETLVAMDIYLGAVQDETHDLLEKFRLTKDKAAIDGSVLALIRSSKDDAGAAQNALGQIVLERRKAMPLSHMDNAESWWALAESLTGDSI